jgi:curved DNA-binding protein CbpA
MIQQFIIDNQLYLDFLEINLSDIPITNNVIHKQDFFKLIESKFRHLARKYHPDYGGNEKDFKFLLKCKSMLIENENSELNLSLKIKDEKFQLFDPKSMAGELGNQIFELISSWCDELRIKPVFKPTEPDHTYEWIFNIINHDDMQLSLNVQNLNDDLAELSHELYKDDSMSVLVCLFIPSKQMISTKVEYDNSVQLAFNDKILIESSNASDVSEYFSSIKNLKADLEKIKLGIFKSKNNNILKVKKPQEAIEKDKKLLEYLQNYKIFKTTYDETAADFLDKL